MDHVPEHITSVLSHVPLADRVPITLRLNMPAYLPLLVKLPLMTSERETVPLMLTPWAPPVKTPSR